MPIYEYRCAACHERFSTHESLSEHGLQRPVCPRCRSQDVEQVLTPFFAKTVRKS